ncbi:MAG: aquaporin [Opitutales bacterium]
MTEARHGGRKSHLWWTGDPVEADPPGRLTSAARKALAQFGAISSVVALAMGGPIRAKPSYSTLMRKYFVEMLGTFFLVFTVGMTAIEPGAGLFAPIAIGGVLAVMIFAGGHLSGGHFNPAVSIGAWLRGSLPVKEVPGYLIAQFTGGVAGALTAIYLKGETLEVVALSPEVVPALLAEFLFTFALVWVVLNVATAMGTKGNSFYGLAIGVTVMAGAFAVGHISGGAFNPAVAVGISMIGAVSWSAFWIFLVANFGGGIAAALAFRYTHPDECR